MVSMSKKQKLYIGIILTATLFIGAAILVGTPTQNTEDEHIVGGKYSHLYYNTGEITDIDTDTKTFKMTVADINRDHIFGGYFKVYYSGLTSFDAGTARDVKKGASVEVGYLRPITQYPVQAMVIHVL